MQKTICFILVIGILAGCLDQTPNAEAALKNSVVEHNTNYSNTQGHPFPALFVQYKTKGNHVFVECIVTGITFRQSDYSKQKVGKIVVWINGKRKSEVDSAAFIIKGLTPGNHKIKLEVVKLNNVPYGLDKEFIVDIPK
ncbi:hypothetical protein [Neobacillus kokaensis]|uniref:PrcB C-terminal domain-containing protein n=1 Tax=Neobacillus kokaensis TaxID=2759023 RepID=A0ABQ3NBH7_9BACI|nr:hypothetical protein [Neobacillus kokaensis]GHI01276.1 hypothetical protein AM1BK_48180 [Neobacillus kokaensis]